MSALPDVLIYGDTLRHAELRHQLLLVVPDPFLYAETGGGRHVVVSSLERSRIAEADGDQLVLGGSGREAAQLEVIVRACQSLGVQGTIVPAEFPIELADRLRAAGIELIVDRDLFE